MYYFSLIISTIMLCVTIYFVRHPSCISLYNSPLLKHRFDIITAINISINLIFWVICNGLAVRDSRHYHHLCITIFYSMMLMQWRRKYKYIDRVKTKDFWKYKERGKGKKMMEEDEEKLGERERRGSERKVYANG